MCFRLSANRYRSILILVSLVLAQLVPMSAYMAQSAAMLKTDPFLTCEISGRASYRSGEPAIFEFQLKNHSSRAIHVLKWHTPLEGIFSRIFKVTRNGEELDYLGPMVRRGEPTAEDYQEISPNKSASARFDLAKVYDLTPAGKYHLKFISRLLDITTNSKEVPRPSNRQQPLEIVCNDIAFVIQKQPDGSPP